MAEKNINQSVGESSIKKIKARSMLKKQRIAIILMIAVIAALIVALLVVKYFAAIFVFPDVDGTEYYIKKVDGLYALCYKDGTVLDINDSGLYLTDLGTQVKIDPQSGASSVYAVVDIEGTEEVGYQEYVLMFKQLTYDASSTKDQSRIIQSIEVHNEFGGYTFVRGDNNTFDILGNEETPYNKETFAQLAVACGYTLSMRRLKNPAVNEDGGIDFAEYGLAPEVRTRTETDENGNEIEVEYQYEPAWYVITTMDGASYKVTVGDMVVTGAGYYAKYEGRDTIYILGSSGISDILLKNVEVLVTPTIVYPMGSTSYFNVIDFVIYDNIDYDAIVAALEEKFGDPDELEDESIDEDEFNEYYAEMFEKYSHKICHFSYRELKERLGTMYAYLPYESKLEYVDGYYINSNNIDNVLYALYDTDFTEVVKIAPGDEDFEKYGIDEAAYVISFYYKTKDDAGNEVYVPNYIEISAKNEAGVFYAYSSTYDMIVGISESSFDFLEWEEMAWYDPSYIQMDISHVNEIIIESPEQSVHFVIEDSASRYMTYVAKSGSSFNIGETAYSIVKNSSTGKYCLSTGGSALTPIYQGDYLITPLQYMRGAAESENYIFVETQEMDLDSNGENDSVAYYFYNIAYNNGECVLIAQVALADMNGNKLDNDRTVLGEAYMSTEYFVTNSNYVYLTGKNTYVGQQLEKTYGGVNRGSWAKGNLFVTADEKYVLVNSATGEWCVLNDYACNIYFADKDTSRLAQRGVEIPAKYGSDGKVLRHPETFYPTTEEKLQYDEESGGIQVYNTQNKVWENATYDDCTIGVWNTGAYYLTAEGNLIVVNEETGDWGTLSVSSNENYIAEILADGKVLDYVIKTTNHVGKVVNSTATDNFKQFYGGMLYASLEGTADLSEEEKAALRQLDDFSSANGDSVCQLKITILGQDLHGNRRDTVYRFYQYTERKSYITIESISYEDGYVSSSEKAYGNFYVLRTYVDKIIEDAKRIVDAEEVTAVTKY